MKIGVKSEMDADESMNATSRYVLLDVGERVYGTGVDTSIGHNLHFTRSRTAVQLL